MRVIVVDQDSTMLEGIVRALRDHFVIDVVSTKAGCIDLLRQNEFDIVVACERLEDGSGLELLGQIAKRWPATLRVFAAEPARLRMLGVRLGPFGLLQTLAYPIDPWKLYDALSRAGADRGADEGTAGSQNFVLGDDEPTDPSVPPLVSAVSRPKPAAPSRGSSGRSRRTVRAPDPNPFEWEEFHAQTSARSEAAPAQRSEGEAMPATGRAPWNVTDGLYEPRFVTSPTARKPARRLASVMLAGSAVTLCMIFVGVTWLHRKPVVKAVPAAREARKVDSLLGAVEADFARGDLGQAQVDLDQLRAIAPANPRLPFFDALLSRGEGVSAQPSSHLRKANRAPSDSSSRRQPGAVPAPRAAMRSAAAPAASKGNRASARKIPVSGQPDSQSPRTVAEPAASPAQPVTQPLAQTSAKSAGPPPQPVPQSLTQEPQAASLASQAPVPGAQPFAQPPAQRVAHTTEAGAPGVQPEVQSSAKIPTAAPPDAQSSAQTTASAQLAATGGARAIPALLDPRRKAEMEAGLIAPPVTADAQLVRRVSPEYPTAAARKGVEGSVEVRFTITSRGTVENPAVISADPPNVFDRAAIDAVRHWRYDPRVVDGKPVDSQSQVRLQFKLNASTSQ